MLTMGGVLSLAIIQLSDVFTFVVDQIAAFARHGVFGVGDYESWAGYLNFLSHVELLYPEFEIFLEVRFS